MPAAVNFPRFHEGCSTASCAQRHGAFSRSLTRLPAATASGPWRSLRRSQGDFSRTTVAGSAPSDQPTAGDGEEPALSLEEWLQLEAEADAELWDGSDEDTNDAGDAAEDAPVEASSVGPSGAAQQSAAGSSASGGAGGGSPETSWAADLPYKLKPGDRRWEGEVPPDVVVISPPQRNADGNLILPPGVQQPSGHPAAPNIMQQRRQQQRAPQRQSPQQQAAQPLDGQQLQQQEQEEQQQQQLTQKARQQPQPPQRQRQRQRQQARRDGGRGAGGRKQGGGRSGSKDSSAAAPAWMRNLPPSQ